jgi:CheY-like chemotaxis protein
MENLNILALEDEEHNIKAFFGMMKAICEPVSVTVKKTYDEAIAEYHNRKYDALIIDLRLEGEGKQGEEFIRDIRKENTQMPIYILTGVEYDRILSEKDFKEKYNIKRWVKKPIYAGDFCKLLLQDFQMKV